MRAFCKDTSVPNTGASAVRITPRILPNASTTETVTCADEPKGCLICARALFATAIADLSNCVTSALVYPFVVVLGATTVPTGEELGAYRLEDVPEVSMNMPLGNVPELVRLASVDAI